MNLNVNRPVPAPVPAQPAVEAQENAENVNRSETDGAQQSNENESEPLVAQAEPTVQEEPQVPLITIVRTFVLSFFSSIIPEAPALWMNVLLFAAIYVSTYLMLLLYLRVRRTLAGDQWIFQSSTQARKLRKF